MDTLKDKFKNNKKLIFMIMIPVFCIGIIISIAAFNASKKAIYEEHDKHLYHMASSIDNNMNNIINNAFGHLFNIIQNETMVSAERQYASFAESVDEYTDSGELQLVLSNLIYPDDDCVTRALVMYRNEFIASSDETDKLNYSQVDSKDGNLYWLFRDEDTGKLYYGLSYPAFVYGFTNFVLIDVENLYKSAIGKVSYDDYWIVMYDEKSGLILQNDGISNKYFMADKETLTSNNDGYSVLMSFQDKKESGSAVYNAFDSTGKSYKSRIYVIPSQLSENDRFTIGIAINDEYITKPMRKRNIMMILAAFLMAASAAVIVFFLVHSGKREEELAMEISALEKEKEISNALLEQQKELAHHTQLETIGTLTAGVAHEFNNMLSPIMGNSFLILQSNPEDSENYDNALEIYNASTRAKELVSRISRLSRKNPMEIMKRISPNVLCSNVLLVANSAIPKNVNIVQDYNAKSFIMGDEPQLEHTVLNLVINAFHAMESDGGTLTISTIDDENSVIITVSDTGTGINEDLLETIFTPFFTTKEAGKGTGLGLAIAKQTIQNHGGTIVAGNNEGKGASFVITLKKADEQNGEEE